jgi:hypothetical protein
MATTTTDHNEDLSYWKTLLRAKLAEAPESLITTRTRAEANKAREAGTLSVPFLRLLVRELDAQAARPTSQRRLPKPFPNKRAQACERCAAWIEAGEGLCERSDDDTRWIVSHKEGQCPVILFEGVPEGRYAIDWAEGEVEDIKFYQIKEATLYAQASAELWQIKDTEHIAKVLDAIKIDPKAASILYGLKLGACGVCGRTLTNQESRDFGIGPICREKMGW